VQEGTFGRRLAILRRNKGLREDALGHKILASAELLKNLENEHFDRLPPWEQLRPILLRLADFFKCNREKFLEEFQYDAIQFGYSFEDIPLVQLTAETPLETKSEWPRILYYGVPSILIAGILFVSAMIIRMQDATIPTESEATQVKKEGPSAPGDFSVVTLRALGEVKVVVTIDGQTRHDFLFEAGETRQWRLREKIELRIWDDRLVQLSFDGHPVDIEEPTGTAQMIILRVPDKQ
jgi:hypothetical protein